MAPVLVLLCFAIGAVLLAMVTYVVRVRSHREEVKELRGDWWPRFEAEFRTYASWWEATRKRRSRRDLAS